LNTYGLNGQIQPGRNEGKVSHVFFTQSLACHLATVLTYYSGTNQSECSPEIFTVTEHYYAVIILDYIHSRAGTNQLMVEAGCHTNTDRQDLDERRNNQLPDLKRQRLTGAFGEASPVR
jgi:hypothetical protein